MYIRSTCTCSPSFFPSCLIRLLDLLLMFIQVYTNGTVYTYHVIAAKEEEEEEIEVWQRAKGKGRMRRKKKINTIVFVVGGCRCVYGPHKHDFPENMACKTIHRLEPCAWGIRVAAVKKTKVTSWLNEEKACACMF